MGVNILIKAVQDGVGVNREGRMIAFRKDQTGIVKWRSIDLGAICQALVLWDENPETEITEVPLTKVEIIGMQLTCCRIVIVNHQQ